MVMSYKSCLTRENLQRRRFRLCSKCLLCGSRSESIYHLFIHYYIIVQYGNCSLTWCSLNGTCPWTHLSFWSAETSRALKKKKALFRKEVNCLLLFYFWCEQNFTRKEEYLHVIESLQTNILLLLINRTFACTFWVFTDTITILKRQK